MTNLATSNKSQGFSLVEVMIATLVLGVGILSVSKLQMSLLRSGSDANYRSVASNIVHKKIDDLRRFTHLQTLDTWDNLVPDPLTKLRYPSSLAFANIETNKGGRIHSGTIYAGDGNSYELSWTIFDYYYDGTSSSASTTPSSPYPDFKLAHVVVTWDGVGDDTNSVVSFDTAIYAYNPSLTAVSASAGTGNDGPTDKLDDNSSGGTDVTVVDGAVLVGGQVAPNISAKGASNVVAFESIIHDAATGAIQKRDRFKTVACVCKEGTDIDFHLTAYTTWDNTKKLLLDVVGVDGYPNEYTAVALNGSTGDNDQAPECETCCQDGVPDTIHKVCRLKEVGGRFTLYPNWKLVGFNVIPESFTHTSTNTALYSTYVTSLIRNTAEFEKTQGASYFLNPASFNNVNNSFISTVASELASGNHDKTIQNTTMQLQSRAIYMDEIPDGVYEGTTYGTTNIPLDRIPFYEVDLTKLTGWIPDEDDSSFAAPYTGDGVTSNKWRPGQHDLIPTGGDKSPCQSVTPGPNCVSNQRLIDSTEGTYTRGVFYSADIIGPTTVQSKIYIGNDGWVDREVNDELTSTASIDITVVTP